MVRFAHILKPTKTSKIPKRWILLDCESTETQTSKDKIEHTFEVGYAQHLTLDDNKALNIESELGFLSPGEFWDYFEGIANQDAATWIMAHNVVYLLIILDGFKTLHDRGWKMDGFYSRELTSVFRWKKGDQRVKLIDTGNFYDGSLEKWGKKLGLGKDRITSDAVSPGKKFSACMKDVGIIRGLLEHWITFLTSNDLGSFKVTTASTAFNAFRYKYLRARVHIHDKEDAIKLERDAYSGGRTECLYIGQSNDGPFYYLDVNNMYGYVLSEYDYPVSIWNYREDSNPYRLRYKLDRYAVVAEVDLQLTQNPFPFKIFYHSCYPVGNFRTVLTTPELELALANDWVTGVHRIAWYRKLPLFREFALSMRAKRERYQAMNAEGMEGIVKLMINGLYGKFGQHDFIQERIGKCDPSIYRREQVFDVGDEEYYDQVYLGGTIFRERHAGESFHSFPAIAAHVTAYARLYLYSLMRQVPRGSLYYVDTDCLIVDQRGKDALKYYIDPEKMGMLKVEHVSPYVQINGPKHYAMKGRDRHAGIKDSANPLGKGEYEQWEWPKLRGLLQRGMSGEYTINRVVKGFDGEIWSGRRNDSGWVDPYLLDHGDLIDAVPLYSPLRSTS